MLTDKTCDVTGHQILSRLLPMLHNRRVRVLVGKMTDRLQPVIDHELIDLPVIAQADLRQQTLHLESVHDAPCLHCFVMEAAISYVSTVCVNQIRHP
ncbi:hypothetical protein [Microbacterium maritypicum]